MTSSPLTTVDAPVLTLSATMREAMNPQRFAAGRPFPVAIIDDFLPASFADGLHGEILALQDHTQSNDYIFAKNKFEYPALQEIGVYGKELKRFLLSEPFAETLSHMYGRTLFVDTAFTGGGIHRGGAGSFLDMHADFGRHPGHENWVRELNILIYMNKNWSPEYRGSLELKNRDTGDVAAIEPLFNRCVLMLTKDHTLHGYKPTAFPAGQYRNSIAAYAYSLETDESKLAELSTTTRWQPVDASPTKRLIASVTPRLVAIKQRLFGSKTVRNSDKR
ncbi:MULTISPECIES: 2OG-Fe(II) oxygenase [Sphingomonas]|jgi:hypothetical protein|uniref:2OG-Fe(II) oxygenase n=1 Tax=Sphingomonas TaxID=13687 RepID=UPI00082FF035|nr:MULTISPECIES: 2OG-Fe(II) oxygenase [Sphingomonas]MBY0300234.1 2OG-Fe(II) oxygenase [Sphingomonas ginsenosidimutans]